MYILKDGAAFFKSEGATHGHIGPLKQKSQGPRPPAPPPVPTPMHNFTNLINITAFAYYAVREYMQLARIFLHHCSTVTFLDKSIVIDIDNNGTPTCIVFKHKLR